MYFIKSIVNIIIIAFISMSYSANAQEKHKDLLKITDSLFKNSYPGCIVIYNENDDDIFIYDSARAERRYGPASTYKIFNTLLAFESGVASDSTYTIKWDGTKHSFDSWNRNHSLNSAFKNSVVWYYQALARKLGRDYAQKYLDTCDYGNTTIGKEIDRYWLDNSLQISAMEQIQFLRKLKNNQLPFSAETMKKTKEIMLQDTSFGELYYKTGLLIVQKVGWFVGWQVLDGKTYYFALNISYDKLGSLFIESRKNLSVGILRLYLKSI